VRRGTGDRAGTHAGKSRAGPFTRGRRLALGATAAIYLAGVAAVLVFIDDDMLRAALSLPATLVAMLLGLSLVNYAVRAWRWLILGRFLGLRVPVAANVAYYLAGYSLTSTPGKAGEAVRLWFLKSGHGVPYARSLPLMLADRAIDLWAVLLLSIVSIAGFAQYRWQGAALALVIAAISVPILFPRRFEPLLIALYGLLPRRGRLLVRARRTMRAMADLSSWRSYGLTLGPSMLGWFAEGAALFLLLRHLGADIGLLNAVFIFCFSIIVGALSMLPGGLGSTEATIVILLKALGVDLSTALAATAIIRITTFWFAVAIGMLLMPVAMNAAARAAGVASVGGAPGP
jgi:glycosyltransferase 2 family protein